MAAPSGTTTKIPPRPATLNRHKRGRPKFAIFKRLGHRILKIMPPLLILGAIGGGIYLLNYFGVI